MDSSCAPDDEFFDDLLDDFVEPYRILGNPFNASLIARTDSEARKDIRLALLQVCQEEAKEVLDPLSFDRLEYLKQKLAMPDVVPFIGAGMSVSAGFPAWQPFLRQCAQRRLPEWDFAQLLAAGDYIGVTDSLLATPGGELYMDERLSVFDRPANLRGMHKILPMLFAGMVYTTNYDRVLEEVYRGADLRAVTSSRGWEGPKAARNRGDRVLLKLHGDAKNVLTRVLTRAEYDAAYAEGSPLRRDLSELFSEFLVVFIGCSLVQDKTLDVAYEAAVHVGREKGLNHMAFLPLPDDDDCRKNHEEFLAERRIFPIWYPAVGADHSILGRLLWLLAATRA